MNRGRANAWASGYRVKPIIRSHFVWFEKTSHIVIEIGNI